MLGGIQINLQVGLYKLQLAVSSIRFYKFLIIFGQIPEPICFGLPFSEIFFPNFGFLSQHRMKETVNCYG